MVSGRAGLWIFLVQNALALKVDSIELQCRIMVTGGGKSRREGELMLGRYQKTVRQEE